VELLSPLLHSPLLLLLFLLLLLVYVH